MRDMEPVEEIALFLRRLKWAAVGVAVCWLLWLLAPVLTPFVLAAMLGWLGDPLVDKLQARGRSRDFAVGLVFTGMTLLVLLALVLLVPTIERQVLTLWESLPAYRDWLMLTALPWLEARTKLEITQWLDLSHLFELVRSNWERAGGVATTLLGYVSRSGFALLTLVANVALLPVLTFFFLRDWDVFVERAAALVPRDHLGTASRLARESSDTLGAFLRGQFLVMLILGVMYAIGLWAVGLNLGILIGLGLAFFVARWFSGAISAMTRTMQAMSQGNLDELITGTEASEITLFTTVGLPMKPSSAGRGGLARTTPRLPSRLFSRLVSSPQT